LTRQVDQTDVLDTRVIEGANCSTIYICRFISLNILILSKLDVNRTEKWYAYENRQNVIFQYNVLGSYIFYYSYCSKYQIGTYMFSIYVKSTKDYNKI